MDASLEQTCRGILLELNLVASDATVKVAPLTGGVSSDILYAQTPSGQYCIKFALSKLKVESDWFAPVHRNLAEYNWLKFVGNILPDNVPNLIGRSDTYNGFVMEFVAGETVSLWKSDLFATPVETAKVRAVAQALGTIHAHSAQPGFDDTPFHNGSDFDQLRLEPYFLHLVDAYPALMARILEVVEQQRATQPVLIHGDVSPKNIMFRNGAPVFLDAECATMGDPAFDVGFCMNHLILKALHTPAHRQGLLQAVADFWDGYSPHITWEDPKDLEARLLGLLPLFMLARVDSKSPVEYLESARKDFVRALAPALVLDPAASMADHIDVLKREMTT